jgi:hypothetical protein
MTAFLSTVIWIWGITAGAFVFVNSLASAASKKSIYELIVSKSAEINQLPKTAKYLFERIFGPRHFSIRCILSSIIASLLAISLFYILRIILMMYIYKDTAASHDYFHFVWSELTYPFQVESRISFAVSVVANLMFDYIALLKTRLLIRALTKANLSLVIGLLFLVLDFVFSFALFQSFYLLLYVVAFFVLFGKGSIFLPASDPYSFWSMTEVMILLRSLTYSGYPPGTFYNFLTHSHAIPIILIVTLLPVTLTSVFFYASIMPSVWLWLFLFAVVASRSIAPIFPWAIRALDFEQNPITMVGYVLATMLSLLWVVFSVGLMLFTSLLARL